MAHSGKVGVVYVTDNGNHQAVLQAADIATAVGNANAAVGTERLSRKVKPRKIALRAPNGGTSPGGSATFTYTHYVFGTPGFVGAPGYGTTITDGVATWTVCGYDDEVYNGATSS